MANRVTATEVRVIFDASSDITDAIVTSHIDIANDLVTGSLSSSGLSSTRLANIELYLAAHFLALRDPSRGMVEAEWVSSEAKVDFSSDFGQGLKSTHYGQQVLLLDTSGTFANLGKTKARFRVI